MPELITSHKVNDADRGGLMIEAIDEPGPSGACHHYRVSVALPGHSRMTPRQAIIALIDFQDGSPADVGINGLTQEALLAVLIHRLDGFQEGKFACQENYQARKYLAMALECLHARTRERSHRGVEGQLVQ